MDPITPQITSLYDITLPTKRRAIVLSQSQVGNIQFQILNYIGNPIDLATLSFDDGDTDSPFDSVTVKLREVISTKSSDVFSVSCTTDDVSSGLISFFIPAGVTKNPGVYTAEFACLTDAGDVTLTNKCYIWVDRGLFGSPRYPNAGPPTIDEIRLFMRDNAPEENRLLDNFEFDLAEMCHVAELGVRIWNEAQPPVNIAFNTLNYPPRFKWLGYIAGSLMQMAARRFLRNHLPYQSAGLAIDDQNKYQQYEQLGGMLIADYREWIKQKKVEINCYNAITSLGSSYRLYYQILTQV